MLDILNSTSENLYVNLTKENIKKIEELTQGQSTNELWFSYRKGVITASMCHEVSTKIDKISRGSGVCVNMWALNQRVSGLTFANPNIPALKYGRDMEIEAVNSFYELMKKKHNLKLSECGLFLERSVPVIGGSPDRIMTCDCCLPACLEVKCPFSVNHMSPTDPNVRLPYLVVDKDVVVLNKNHKYHTQCKVQMAVTSP